MDDLDNKSYNSESGTPYEPPQGHMEGDGRYVPDFEDQQGNTIPQHDVNNGQASSYQNSSAMDQQPYNSGNYAQQQNDPYGKSYQNQSGYNPYGNIRQYDSPQYNNNQNYNGGYQQNYQYDQPACNNGYYGQQPYAQNVRNDSGLAIASMVIALVNLIVFRTLLSIIAVPLSIIFAIVSLVQKRSGKGFAVTGIIVSVISMILIGTVIALFVKVYPDFEYFAENQQQIITEYKEDGTIPEQYEKYNDPKYDKFWKSMGLKDFNEFFGMLIDKYISDYSYDDYDYEFEEDYDHGITDLALRQHRTKPA
ncbi:MAG TPA: DUF4190 domain-containing protein [Ruminococcus flavefaciens]|nr:DUF4190 domain-containing protein [Ruminococcus flavefaciens]HQM01945.1 DUF4190 domain-containing protein [Ruminococcus flavefaciens]